MKIFNYRQILILIFALLCALSLEGQIPTAPRADWRLIPLQASATSHSTELAAAFSSGNSLQDIPLAFGESWTVTLQIPATPVGGMFTFALRLDGKIHTNNPYTVTAETSLNSSNGTDGDWENHLVSLYRPNQRSQRLQKVSFDHQARWLKITITNDGAPTNPSIPAGVNGKLIDLGLYQFSADGRNDYWLCVGASIQERGVHQGLFREQVNTNNGMDPVIFNVAIGGYRTNNWYDMAPLSYPNNLLKQVLDDHPHARYVAIHIGGNNVSAERPYVSKDSDSGDSQLAEQLEGIIQQIIAAGKYPIVSRISYRNYTSTPSVNNGANQENGSLPYNTNIVDPLITQYLPEQVNPSTGVSYVDAYGYFFEKPELISSDGVHMVGLANYEPSPEESVWSTAIWANMASPLVHRKPTFIKHPLDTQAQLGDSVELSVEVAESDVSYQWLKNGVVMPNETSASLRISNVQNSDLESYQVLVNRQDAPAYPSNVARIALPELRRDTNTLNLDFGGVVTANPSNNQHWNQVDSHTPGTSYAAGTLVNELGNLLPTIGLTLTHTDMGSDTGIHDEINTTPLMVPNGTPYPLNAAGDGFYVRGSGSNGPRTITLTVSGLNSSDLLSLHFFGTRNYSTSTRIATFTVVGAETTVGNLDTKQNSSTLLSFENIQPALDGTLSVTFSATAESNYAYWNTLQIVKRSIIGMSYTAWQTVHLPELSYDEVERSALGDPDSDDVANLIEFFTSSDPTDATTPSLESTVSNYQDGSGKYIAYEYNRSKNAAVSTIYQVSENLIDWYNTTLEEVVVDADVYSDGTVERIRVLLPMDEEHPKQFIRTKIILI